MNRLSNLGFTFAFALLFTACGQQGELSIGDNTGNTPLPPAPQKNILPEELSSGFGKSGLQKQYTKDCVNQDIDAGNGLVRSFLDNISIETKTENNQTVLNVKKARSFFDLADCVGVASAQTDTLGVVSSVTYSQKDQKVVVFKIAYKDNSGKAVVESESLHLWNDLGLASFQTPTAKITKTFELPVAAFVKAGFNYVDTKECITKFNIIGIASSSSQRLYELVSDAATGNILVTEKLVRFKAGYCKGDSTTDEIAAGQASPQIVREIHFVTSSQMAGGTNAMIRFSFKYGNVQTTLAVDDGFLSLNNIIK